MENQYITYLHHKVKGGRLTACLATDDKVVEVGLAFSSPNDQFERAIGRKRSFSRLQGKEKHRTAYYTKVDRNAEMKLKEQVQKLIDELLGDNVVRQANDEVGKVLSTPSALWYLGKNPSHDLPQWVRD